jgi:hypothetical protein
MIKLLGCFLISAATPLFAKDYYVAPDGNDDYSGSLTDPFASINQGQKSAGPGDTIYIRGGTYRMSESMIAERDRNKAMVISLTKSGKPGRPIRYFAYQNEQPVFDFAEVKPRGYRVTAFAVKGSYLHLRGLSVVGVQVTITGHTQSICFSNDGSNNVFEALSMHDGQAIGFWLGRGSNNLVLNCDAYRNHDHTSENKRGGNVDGFGFHVPPGSKNNVFRGCRAWFNSDDGFDLITTHEAVLIENCWSFYNGYDPSFKALGDGNGFKLGGFGVNGGELPKAIPRHEIRGSLAVRNRAGGFYANHHPGGLDLIQNTAYLNRVNFNMLGRNLDHTEDVPGFDHKMINNLGYKGRDEISNISMELCELLTNSFSMNLALRDKDFESLDEADLVKPRKPNSDLPDIRFLHLKAGSAAIGKGTNAGRVNNSTPDLGAFERIK